MSIFLSCPSSSNCTLKSLFSPQGLYWFIDCILLVQRGHFIIRDSDAIQDRLLLEGTVRKHMNLGEHHIICIRWCVWEQACVFACVCVCMCARSMRVSRRGEIEGESHLSTAQHLLMIYETEKRKMHSTHIVGHSNRHFSFFWIIKLQHNERNKYSNYFCVLHTVNAHLKDNLIIFFPMSTFSTSSAHITTEILLPFTDGK